MTNFQMKILLLIIKKVISLKKRNKIAMDLFTKKYRKRIVKPKKGKGVSKEEKNNLV